MGKEELGKSRFAKQTGVDSLETFKARSEYKLKFRSDCKVLHHALSWLWKFFHHERNHEEYQTSQRCLGMRKRIRKAPGFWDTF